MNLKAWLFLMPLLVILALASVSAWTNDTMASIKFKYPGPVWTISAIPTPYEMALSTTSDSVNYPPYQILYIAVPSDVTFVTSARLNLTTLSSTGLVDAESAYVCNASSSGFYPACANAVDEDWSTYASQMASGNQTVFENTTYSGEVDVTNFYWKAKIEEVLDSTSVYVNIKYFNYTSRAWVNLLGRNDATCEINLGPGTYTNWTRTCTKKIPEDGINRTSKLIQIQTIIADDDAGLSGSKYYEGELVKEYFPSEVNLSINNVTSIYSLKGTFNQTNNRTNNFASSINAFLPTCAALSLIHDGYCYVPIYLSTNRTGTISLSDMRFENNGLIEGAFTHSPIVYDTATTTLSVNVTYDSAFYTASTGALVYNGTSYPATKNQSGNNATFTSTIDVPLVQSGLTQNNSLYWIITLTNSSSSNPFTTSNNSQIANRTNLSICGAAPYNSAYVNFTLKDENNATEVNGTFQATILYYLGSGSVKRNLSINDVYGNRSRFNLCFMPKNVTMFTDADINYDAAGYDPRQYFLRNATLSNSTTYINLFILSGGQKYFLETRVGISSLPSAIVTVTKYFVGEGVYKTIGIRQTDSDGNFVEYLEPEGDYKFTATKDGATYGPIQKTASCKTSPCEMTIQFSSSSTDLWSGYNDVLAENVVHVLSYDKDTKIVSVDYTDTTGLAHYVRLEVNRISLNESVGNICNNQLYSATGTITCNMSGYDGDFKATVYISRSPEKVVGYLTFIINAISDNLGLVGLFVSMLMIIIIVIAVGSTDLSAGIIAIPLSMSLLKMMGFLPLSWGLIVAIFVLGFWLASKVRA